MRRGVGSIRASAPLPPVARTMHRRWPADRRRTEPPAAATLRDASMARQHASPPRIRDACGKSGNARRVLNIRARDCLRIPHRLAAAGHPGPAACRIVRCPPSATAGVLCSTIGDARDEQRQAAGEHRRQQPARQPAALRVGRAERAGCASRPPLHPRRARGTCVAEADQQCGQPLRLAAFATDVHFHAPFHRIAERAVARTVDVIDDTAVARIEMERALAFCAWRHPAHRVHAARAVGMEHAQVRPGIGEAARGGDRHHRRQRDPRAVGTDIEPRRDTAADRPRQLRDQKAYVTRRATWRGSPGSTLKALPEAV